jgi:predicted nucleic acid-binding protein
MASLLDTNVLSELRRPRPEPRVVAFVADRPLGQLYVSTVTSPKFALALSLSPTLPPRRTERLAHAQGAADV